MRNMSHPNSWDYNQDTWHSRDPRNHSQHPRSGLPYNAPPADSFHNRPPYNGPSFYPGQSPAPYRPPPLPGPPPRFASHPHQRAPPPQNSAYQSYEPKVPHQPPLSSALPLPPLAPAYQPSQPYNATSAAHGGGYEEEWSNQNHYYPDASAEGVAGPSNRHTTYYPTAGQEYGNNGTRVDYRNDRSGDDGGFVGVPSPVQTSHEFRKPFRGGYNRDWNSEGVASQRPERGGDLPDVRTLTPMRECPLQREDSGPPLKKRDTRDARDSALPSLGTDQRLGNSSRVARDSDAGSKSRDARSISRDSESRSRDARSSSRDVRPTSRDVRSNSRDDRSISRDDRSISRDVRSNSRDDRSISRDVRSNSRDDRSISRDVRSNSRDARSNSRDAGSISRERRRPANSRDSRSNSRDVEPVSRGSNPGRPAPRPSFPVHPGRPIRKESRASWNARDGSSSRKPASIEAHLASVSSQSRGRTPSRHDQSTGGTTEEDATVAAEAESPGSEREAVLRKYRKDYCASGKDMEDRMEVLSRLKPEELLAQEKKVWTRSSPAELCYQPELANAKVVHATPKLVDLCDRFRTELVERAAKVQASRPKFELPPRKTRKCTKHTAAAASSDSSCDSDSSTDQEDNFMEEIRRKRIHPHRLHNELWYNEAGEMNDGPLCRCSAKSRRYGIRHGIYAGEAAGGGEGHQRCDPHSNNAARLHHYRITISPPTNFLTKTPTIVTHDEHEFIFEGFSMFSHFPLVKLPTCKVIRFNIDYTILYVEEKPPTNFTVEELDLVQDYLFREILELVDLDFKAAGDPTGCSQFHFLPRFVRDLPDEGKEILSMNEVLAYLLHNSGDVVEESQLADFAKMTQHAWQSFADDIKGMVVTFPGKKPCSVRVDQLDRSDDRTAAAGGDQSEGGDWPQIVHFGIRPPQLSYAGHPEYQKAWRDYVKFRHLVANMSKPSFEDKRKLEAKENKLQEMRIENKMKRDVTVAVSSLGFHRTGIMCDMVQHAMLIPVLVCHLRFHRSCDVLEQTLGYRFENRFLLQLALTHPSYRENFGTNPDHARNSLTNCGIRQPEYGDRRIHYMNTRKRGINTLINIMSSFGERTETESLITHNERLEFLGDAVVEFLTSIHLFHMFPDLEEGGLATYRAAIVQNQHLAVLAKRLNLEQFMLYAHGSDLCHDLELRHAMANCFEALMGALFLDGNIDVADRVFGETLWKVEPHLLDVWVDYPPHPLQEQEPLGDRKWIPNFELLQNLTKFEKSIGVEFKHIRLLARAFTDRSIGYTNLTLGSNQRLEFLGDTVLQLIASEYLYKFFPEHHEGHLSLLRSALVNNRTQAVVCDDLGMTSYALYANPKGELKTKDRADLLEAFLGALYVDKDLDYCHVFCHVCFFPRLESFIMNQDWNDPKSKLQQCCLTLRTMDGGEPDIPVYKVTACKGPTNTRVYTVAVYFRRKRLADASGHSIQQAEMNAAKEALERSHKLFPQLDHQKRVIAKSMKKQEWPHRKILRGRDRKRGANNT